jgi:hypothetical protein
MKIAAMSWPIGSTKIAQYVGAFSTSATLIEFGLPEVVSQYTDEKINPAQSAIVGVQ